MPSRELRRLFEHLVPESDAALDARKSLHLDRSSGLPILPEFLRARARLKAAGDGPGLERFRVESRVRRSRGETADLKVLVDRFDPSRSLFRRITLELAVDGSREVEIQGDRAELSGRLRDTLFRFATAGPRLLRLRLGDVPGIAVSALEIGTTGPLVFAAMEIPEALKPALDAHPGAMCLWCTLERAGRVEPLLISTPDARAAVRDALPDAVVL